MFPREPARGAVSVHLCWGQVGAPLWGSPRAVFPGGEGLAVFAGSSMRVTEGSPWPRAPGWHQAACAPGMFRCRSSGFPPHLRFPRSSLPPSGQFCVNQGDSSPWRAGHQQAEPLSIGRVCVPAPLKGGAGWSLQRTGTSGLGGGRLLSHPRGQGPVLQQWSQEQLGSKQCFWPAFPWPLQLLWLLSSPSTKFLCSLVSVTNASVPTSGARWVLTRPDRHQVLSGRRAQ